MVQLRVDDRPEVGSLFPLRRLPLCVTVTPAASQRRPGSGSLGRGQFKHGAAVTRAGLAAKASRPHEGVGAGVVHLSGPTDAGWQGGWTMIGVKSPSPGDGRVGPSLEAHKGAERRPRVHFRASGPHRHSSLSARSLVPRESKASSVKWALGSPCSRHLRHKISVHAKF